MPVDRFFHPRAGSSRKVSDLSDFEFRVWWTYVLAADDYGVMPRSAIVLQAANKSLQKRPTKVVEKALETVIACGLLVPFTHQGDWFVCQLDWQDFQKVRYPRDTHQPVPPPEVIEKCSRSTAELFRQRSGNSSETFPSLPGAGAHETANANGDGKRQTAKGEEPKLSRSPRRFGRITLHRWQLEELIAILGPNAASFDLDEWVSGLSALADAQSAVLPDRNAVWQWVQSALREECQKRGLAVAGATVGGGLDVDAVRREIARQDAEAGLR